MSGRIFIMKIRPLFKYSFLDLRHIGTNMRRIVWQLSSGGVEMEHITIEELSAMRNTKGLII